MASTSRTRRSNQAKRYTIPDEDFEDEEDVNITPSRRRGRKKKSGADDDDDDDFFEPPQDDQEPDDEPMDIAEENDSDAKVAPTRGPSKKRGPPVRARPLIADEDFTILMPYPIDPRQTQTRVYHGTFQKTLRSFFHHEYFGPAKAPTQTAIDIFRKWAPFEILPSRLLDPEVCPAPTPWVPENFETMQDESLRKWLEQVRELKGTGQDAAQKSRVIDNLETLPYQFHRDRFLMILSGPAGSQQRRMVRPYESWAIDESGNAIDSMESHPPGSGPCAGWMLDVGGLVLSMSWAPLEKPETQVLALAVSPHADQDFDAYQEAPVEDDKRRGVIQLWCFETVRNENGVLCPSAQQARHFRTICFDWGRAKLIRWCPAPINAGGVWGFLAVQCGDGRLYVISIQGSIAADGQDVAIHEKIEKPLACIEFPQEKGIEITSFAWSGINRIVTGLSDGSLALWSVSPQICLWRHSVHNTYVHNIATGYPSQPYLVASTPVSGFSALIDLRNASTEITTTTNPAIVPQPNMLEWSDHLQGFISLVPASKPLNSTVSFYHSRAFSATPRRVMDGEALLSAIAVGIHHPFLLVAMLDGSVWALNPMNRAFAPRHAPPAWKVKMIEHEYVPRVRILDPSTEDDEIPSSCRGISRIMQVFAPVQNRGVKAQAFEASLMNGEAAAATTSTSAGGKKKARPRIRKKKGDGEEDGGGGGDEEEEEDFGVYADPNKVIVREPLSRITSLVWNPNLDVATWAALATGSGLVRVVDLGVDH